MASSSKDSMKTAKPKPILDKVFNDPIHGSIRLHPLLVKIIDTPQFQRLRSIKQLGLCCYVYPGATHTRFEHSIGVAHLAGKLIEKIQREQGDDLGITPQDILCVKIAGLCHDLGHGPFSHLWDQRFLNKFESKWKHETGSQDMLDYLIKDNKLTKEFSKEGLNCRQIKFIKELINPPKCADRTYKMKKKSFLYEIVANKRNGVDVDKWDYFKRDCHYLGLTCSFDIDRAMELVRVAKEKDGITQICFRDKGMENMYQMFQTRLSLHQAACQHKTKNAIDCMVTEALVLADDHLEISDKPGEKGEQKSKISECTKNVEVYVNLTDDVIQRVLQSPKKELKESKGLLKRIQTRDVYKLVGDIALDLKKISEEDIVNGIAAFSRELEPQDLTIDPVTFDFGSDASNPVDEIRFYSKSEPDKAFKIESASKLLHSNVFEENFIRIYCKKADKFDEAERCFNKWREEKKIDLHFSRSYPQPKRKRSETDTKKTAAGPSPKRRK